MRSRGNSRRRLVLQQVSTIASCWGDARDSTPEPHITPLPTRGEEPLYHLAVATNHAPGRLGTPRSERRDSSHADEGVRGPPVLAIIVLHKPGDELPFHQQRLAVESSTKYVLHRLAAIEPGPFIHGGCVPELLRAAETSALLEECGIEAIKGCD